MLAFVIKAVVAALKKFPEFNASLDGDALVYKQYFHIGFAADTPNGLVVPVLRDADQKGILQISQEMGELAKKARDGKLGSADVLEALGANIMLTPAQVAECLEKTGIGFMFAPNHHSAMKNVAPIRREMGVRTIFNILGPLTNPASAPNTLLGVFHPDLVGILVRVMERLGAKHVMVVYGKDGMDEISLGAATMVGELKDGKVSEYEIHPEDFGLQMSSNRSLRVENSAESQEMIYATLANTPGTARDIVVLNAGTALYVANVAESIQQGITLARDAIASGAARARLDEFVRVTQGFSA